MSMISVRTRAIARQRRAVASPAVAAALAQLAQAAGSFVLQVVAAHALGARGLGVVSLCLGVIILVTAVTSGLVGDSLTVLDRHEPSVRAALQGLTIVMVAGGSTLAALALNLTGILDGPQAVAFAVATAVFQLEEVLRRVLMAALRFWTLLIVDGAAVGSTLVALAVLAATGEIEVGSFLVAIAIGQSVGIRRRRPRAARARAPARAVRRSRLPTGAVLRRLARCAGRPSRRSGSPPAGSSC